MYTSGPVRRCPYCGDPLKWIPNRWFSRGMFACERCGEFPDLRTADSIDATVPPSNHAPDHPRTPVPFDADDDSRPRVLMIDDSREQRDLYALMLEHEMKVVTASRGSEGLAIASRTRPDAIVLDVMMPGMDGWEVCRQLKADPRTAEIPVIMLTAQDEPTLAAEASQNGAAMLLTKPCPIEKLTLAINTAIHRG
jgi:CheY-like chemotaxis protein